MISTPPIFVLGVLGRRLKFFAVRKKKLCRSGRIHAKISAKMTLKFTVFGPKLTCFGLFGACGARKWAQHHENFLAAQNNFLFENFGGRARLPEFEIWVKMTPKFGVLAKNSKFWSHVGRYFGMWCPARPKIFSEYKNYFVLAKNFSWCWVHFWVPQDRKNQKRLIYGQNPQISKIDVAEISACGTRCGRKCYFGVKLVILCSQKIFMVLVLLFRFWPKLESAGFRQLWLGNCTCCHCHYMWPPELSLYPTTLPE